MGLIITAVNVPAEGIKIVVRRCIRGIGNHTEKNVMKETHYGGARIKIISDSIGKNAAQKILLLLLKIKKGMLAGLVEIYLTHI